MRCSWLPLNQKVHGLILAATFIWKGLDDDHNMPGASFGKLSWLVLWTVTILMRHCSTSFPQSSIALTFFLLFLIPDQIYAMLSSIGKRPKYYLAVEHNCRAKVVPRAPHLSSLYHVAIGQSASDVKTRGWQFEILVTLWKETSQFATRSSFSKLIAALKGHWNSINNLTSALKKYLLSATWSQADLAQTYERIGPVGSSRYFTL